MHALRNVCLALAGGMALAVAHAQVPQPAAEPGSVPESQNAPPPAKPTRIRVSSGVIAGNKVSGDAPVYPPEAKDQGVQGSVVLHAVIGADGQVKSLVVVSGNSLLANAALDAVKTWVYRPYLLNGVPTEVDTTITVNFNLAAPPNTGMFASPAPPPPLPTGPRIRVSSGVMSGQAISHPMPAIPPGIGTSGGVVLRAVIGRDGLVESLTPVHGSADLAEAVIGTVKHWRYKPYLFNGQPVEVDTTITMYW